MRGQTRTVVPLTGSAMLFSELTPTEARVLELVAQGLSTRQIASLRWVSDQAVTYHIGHLLLKLDATNRAGMVAWAYATGMLDAHSWPPRVAPELVRDRRRSPTPATPRLPRQETSLR